MRITIIAPKSTWNSLEPLISAYCKQRHAVRTISTAGAVPAQDRLQTYVQEADALLVIGSSRRAPQTVLPGPIMTDFRGRLVPVGWLPNAGEDLLRTFALTAASIHHREKRLQPIAVLSQWNPQYLKLSSRIESLLRIQQLDTYRWSSDLVIREEMVRGLRSGMAIALYVGHGRPIGWVGYRGARIHHFREFQGEPVGALLSLCCRTASRRRTGLSFAEAVPLTGVAGAAFGATGDTKHTNNTRWAVSICEALGQGVSNLGELIIKALPLNDQAIADYRILGDPIAPLYGAQTAVTKAKEIQIHP